MSPPTSVPWKNVARSDFGSAGGGGAGAAAGASDAGGDVAAAVAVCAGPAAVWADAIVGAAAIITPAANPTNTFIIADIAFLLNFASVILPRQCPIPHPLS